MNDGATWSFYTSAALLEQVAPAVGRLRLGRGAARQAVLASAIRYGFERWRARDAGAVLVDLVPAELIELVADTGDRRFVRAEADVEALVDQVVAATTGGQYGGKASTASLLMAVAVGDARRLDELDGGNAAD